MAIDLLQLDAGGGAGAPARQRSHRVFAVLTLFPEIGERNRPLLGSQTPAHDRGNIWGRA